MVPLRFAWCAIPCEAILMKSSLSLLFAFTIGYCANGAARADERGACSALAVSDDLSNLSLAIVTTSVARFRAKDLVVADGAKDSAGNVCVGYIGARSGETNGWLPAASITPVLRAPNWVGAWRRGAIGRIDITRNAGDVLELSGTATWRGHGDNIHTAEIAATIDADKATQGFAERSPESDGGQIAFEKAAQDDCALFMRQLGPYLFVRDSGNCGGPNVSFTGLYRRR
jgi:hypothetical protein